MGGFEGQATDIKIRSEHILQIKERLNKILAQHTKQDIKIIERDTERDHYLTPTEAKNYGLIDKIISR